MASFLVITDGIVAPQGRCSVAASLSSVVSAGVGDIGNLTSDHASKQSSD